MIKGKEVNMCFTKKIKEFMLASGKFINFERKATSPLLDDVFFSLNKLDYCSAAIGKKNISKDFQVLAKDFKRVTEEAKQKVKNGEAISSK